MIVYIIIIAAFQTHYNINMEQTIQAKISAISTRHANPRWAAGQMQEVIKENVKLTNRTTQMMLLKELVRRRVPTKDVISIERNQRWNGRGKKDVQLIDFLMKRKVKSAVQELKKQRRKYYEEKDKLYKGGGRLNRHSRIASDFRKVQKVEVERLFKDNLERNKEKVEKLREIKNREAGNAENVTNLFGVKIGDNELDDYIEKPANIWGNAEVGEEAKEVLNLGKKFRLHQKLDSNANKTEIEKGLAIVRWKVKDKDEDGDDDDDEDDDGEVSDNEELLNVEQKIVDLTLKKATDMKFNRRLYAPNAAPEKLESNLQQTREALEEVFEKYKKEKADEKGNIRESNLTGNQMKGLLELKEKTKVDLVIMPTDKTLGLSAESKESYKRATRKLLKSISRTMRRSAKRKENTRKLSSTRSARPWSDSWK